MFIGHFAAGFAAKRFAPRAPLPLLIFAGALSDALWILFFATGIEKVAIHPGLMAANSLDLIYIPFSHSLLMDVVWGALLGFVYFTLRRDRSGAWAIALAVLSHWLLDFITHRPDMPLAPGLDARFGLSLWNSPAATLIVEGALWIAALALYLRATQAKRKAGIFGFWPMIVLLTALWLISLNGAPPPSLPALAATNTVFFAIVFLWAFWMDRVRCGRGL